MDAAADTAGHPEPAEVRSPGQVLAAERERQGLSRADVAQRLHLRPWQVEALETDDYGRLPPGTFLRGFVRNYARALGLDAEAVLSLLAEAGPRQAAPGIVVPTQNIRFDPLGERLSSPYVKAGTLAAIAIALGFAAMYWWVYIRPSAPGAHHEPAATPTTSAPGAAAPVPVLPPAAQPALPPAGSAAAPGAGTTGAPAAAAPEPAAAAPEQPAGRAAPAGTASGDGTGAEAPPAAAAGAAAPPAAAPSAAPSSPATGAPPAPLGPSHSLAFHFQGDSWVEVRDGRGRLLMQRLNPAGTVASVSGRGPLSVIVGNAPEVRMDLDGKPYDLDPSTRVAVARFTIP